MRRGEAAAFEQEGQATGSKGFSFPSTDLPGCQTPTKSWRRLAALPCYFVKAHQPGADAVEALPARPPALFL